MLTKKEYLDMTNRLNKASRKKVDNIEYVSIKAVELLLKYYTGDNVFTNLPLTLNIENVN